MTSFSLSGELAYGARMVESASRWPSQLVVYADYPTTRANIVRPTTAIPGWIETQHTLPFKSNKPEGYKPTGYLWNAQKFAVKCFVWRDAAERLERGVLTWLDADTVIRKRVPAGLSERLLGTADVAYLGRGVMHPETGYVAFRIPEALPLLRWCCDRYTSGKFKKIKTGWTDCHVLRAGMKKLRVPAVDLTSSKSQVWHSKVDAVALSPLGPYVTHLKGKAAKREATA